MARADIPVTVAAFPAAVLIESPKFLNACMPFCEEAVKALKTAAPCKREREGGRKQKITLKSQVFLSRTGGP